MNWDYTLVGILAIIGLSLAGALVVFLLGAQLAQAQRAFIGYVVGGVFCWFILGPLFDRLRA